MSSAYSQSNGDAARRSSPNAGTSALPAAGAPSPTGTKRFDPFAPLDNSTSTYNPPSRSSPSPNSSSTGGPYHSPSGSPNLSSSSLSRAGRPSSLYIPMEDTPAGGLVGNGEQTTAAPQWPFRSGLTADDRRGSTTFPSSPSMINPSYADLGAPPAHLNDYASVPTPPLGAPTAGTEGPLYSSISVVEEARSTTPSRRGLTGSKSGFTASGLMAPRKEEPSALAKSLDTPTAWLLLYFAFNLGLTLYNKLVLQGFPFPWTLTAIQMLSGTIGTQIALNRGFFVQARLTTKEGLIMIAFSVLYTVNIAVSNLSLHLVTVPFHQVVRAMTPLFTILIAAAAFRKRHSRDTYLSLIPVVAGVVFATYGDYSFTAWGFILTLIGTLLAALKTIVTNRVQVGRLKLHPLDLLIRMSPLAFCQCVFFGWTSGELDRVRIYGATEMTQHKAIALAINGAIAFGLNVVSFTANKKTSALTMTVAANVKQVLTIILAVLIFNLSLNPTNLFGITLTLAGGAWYARVELLEKSRASALNNAPTLLPSRPLDQEKL
ncbi:triose-phosphate transporter family-domain-containing protein [Leucosporidium creatinivorum]|uniref:Triose-phosphate transporter family-domain-containing protein n=1 Tax=Leucosporidium creatinivorum TaxID=106004 RepID=A0A1Y2G5Z4_9BASI|nr:triose-phosphate transporter family-domain-containing protein [Leucosporidium creatinivorum]